MSRTASSAPSRRTGAARFLQQYGPGLGDYTAERDALLEGLSMEDVLRLVKEHEREQGE